MSSHSRSPPHSRHSTETRSNSERSSYEPRAPPSRTLYVKEIPQDVETKNVEDLFHKFEGFVALRRLPHFTFVEYETIEQAREALYALKDYKFKSSDRPLVIDFDRDSKDSASRKRKEYTERDREKESKYSREAEASREDSRIREKEYERYRETRERYPREDDYRRPSSGHLELSHSAYNTDPSLLFPRAFGQIPFSGFGLYNGVSHHIKENPCSTLFVGNLPTDVTEREMSILFRFMPGFYGVRLINRDGKFPICFVDFSDTTCATMALQTLQGFKLDKDSIGISIEYDRGSKLDKERERSERERRERDIRDKDRSRDRERDERDRERDERERRGRSH